jgi:O-antigen ligase
MRLDTAAAGVAALFLASCVFGHMVSVRLLLLGAGIVLSAIVVFRYEVRALPPIWMPFLLWGGWALLSLSWSFEPERTLKEWRNEVFYAGAALWICFVAVQARGAVRIFGAVLAAATVLACGFALAAFPDLKAYNEGWHGGPGDHSSALLTLMPCAAVVAWYAHRARWPRHVRLALLALVALMLASAYTTLNRTVWVGLAAEFFVLGGLLLARTPGVLRQTRIRVAVTALGLGAIVGCGAVLITIQAERETVGAKALDRDHRLTLWPQIATHIAERPLVGYGFGRGVLRNALQEKLGKMDENLWHAHNLFLEALLQLGAPGLVLLAVLLGAIVRAGWRAARLPSDPAAACGMALLAMLAGVLMRNMTDSLLARQNALLFWGVTGVLLATCLLHSLAAGKRRVG